MASAGALRPSGPRLAANTRALYASAVPQSAWNPKRQGDPRQVEDPIMVGITLRRHWVPRRWLVGEDPWELDQNAQKEFSTRGLADQYAAQLRTAVNFPAAVAFYQEAKERGVPFTTTFMNLFLAHAQRYKPIAEHWEESVKVWQLYEEMTANGAKADIGTLDLLRNSLHALCRHYCNLAADELAKMRNAQIAAWLRYALIEAEEKGVLKKAGLEEEGKKEELWVWNDQWANVGELNLFNDFYHYSIPKGEVRTRVQERMRFFAEHWDKSRARATRLREDDAKEKSERMPIGDYNNLSRASRAADERLAEALFDLTALCETFVTQELLERIGKVMTPEKVVIGAVPRDYKGREFALSTRPLADWEVSVVMRPEFRKLRGIITRMRLHLVDQYNALCSEFLFRQGQAIDECRRDEQTGQEILENTMRRFHESLLAVKAFTMPGEKQHEWPRPEILGRSRLPPNWRALVDGNPREDEEVDEIDFWLDNLTIGCALYDDNFVWPERVALLPATWRVALSYYQPLEMLQGKKEIKTARGETIVYQAFDLLRFCNIAGVLDGRVEAQLRGAKEQDALAKIDDLINKKAAVLSAVWRDRKAGFESQLEGEIADQWERAEFMRRQPEVSDVFTACVDRIIEQGSAKTAADQIRSIANMAYHRAHLYPNARLNSSLLSAAASMDPEHRVALGREVLQAVRDFDDLAAWSLDHLTKVHSEEKDEGWDPKAPKPDTVADHKKSLSQKESFNFITKRVLSHVDSGVDADFYGLLIQCHVWEVTTDASSSVPQRPAARKSPISSALAWFSEQRTAIETRVQNIQSSAHPSAVGMRRRWEERRRHLLESPSTYDALLRLVHDEVTAPGGAVEEQAARLHHGNIKRIMEEMKKYGVTPNASTYDMLFAIARRSPTVFANLRDQSLREMKSRGREFWWQWFEEV
eukprot:TRINITY_DN914_c4_g1_i1.p1 TRINITY_DN914_c4_g1~~TRINITY_DN914_c4_g1_i1.p1  ORF type:complete len:929 (+),score=287.04 TRINITY_DN914_c4_g1_i1:127-2913(+)